MKTCQMNTAELPPPFRRYIESKQLDPSILGIILFGSWARGNNRNNSDFDLLIITQAETRRLVERVDASVFESVLCTEESAKTFWSSNLDDCADLWSYAKVLFDRDGTVSRLKDFANTLIGRGKPKMAKWEEEHKHFDCEDLVRASEKVATQDPLSAVFLLQQNVWHLTELYFNLRGLWTPPPKQRMAAIQTKAPRFYKLLLDFNQCDGTLSPPSFDRRASLVREMIEDVFNIC